MNERPSAIAVTELNQVRYSFFCQFEWAHHLDKLWRIHKKIDKGICRKGQNNFRPRKFLENPRNETDFYLGKAALVQEKKRTAGSWLTAVDFGNNAVRLIFEQAVEDDDFFVIDVIVTLAQDLTEVSRVGGCYIDKVVFEVEAQTLFATLI